MKLTKDGAIPSYPKIYNLGHKALEELFDGPVTIQEKYDGSQISWRWINGELHLRSKGKMQAGGGAVTDKMFAGVIEYLSGLPPFKNELIYRGELFNKPKHNTLTYARLPLNGIVLYDVGFPDEEYLEPEDLAEFAHGLGVEPAMFFVSGADHALIDGDSVSLEYLEALLANKSSLGGDAVEGIVIKNYNQIDHYTGKTLMGKLVRPEFKEVHRKDWKGRNPSQGDFIQELIDSLNTEARWEKAVQHLRDNGELTGTPKDIGALMKRVKEDTYGEEAEWIEFKLYKHFGPQINRALGRGLPNWYKNKLAEGQFGAD